MHETLHKDKSTPAVVPRSSRILFIPGLLITGFGLIVMAAWYAGYAPLLRVRPSFPPILFNTALLFGLSGGGLLALSRGHVRLAFAFGTAVVAMVLLTLLQHLFGVDLGIDQLFMRDALAGILRTPGRMTYNTASGFALAGLSLLVLSVRRRHPQRHAAVAIFGGLVLVLALFSLFGYVSGMPEAYTKNHHVVGMALLTVAGFLLLGGTLVVHAWYSDRSETQQSPSWMPLLAGIAAMAVVIAIWQALRIQERLHIVQSIQAQSRLVVREIDWFLGERVEALERMARRIETHGGAHRQKWDVDAADYLRHDSAYEAIEWLDAAHRRRAIRFASIGTADGASMRHGFASTASAPEYPAADPGRLSVTNPRGPALRTAKTSSGKYTLQAEVPVRLHGKVTGYVRGVLRLQDALDNILSPEVINGYGVVIYDRETEIYRRVQVAESEMAAGAEYAATVRLVLHGVDWKLRLWPTLASLRAERTHVPETVFVLGGLLALLLTITVHKSQQSRRRARDFHALMEQASDGIVHSDTAGRLLDANAHFCRITGYTPNEIRKLHARDLFQPEDLTAFPLRFPELLAGKVLYSERRLRRKDGGLVPVEISAKRIGERVQAIMRDVSARRQAEAHVLRLGRMLDSSSNEFYAFDAHTLRFVQANQAALANLGYTLDELQQLTPLDIKPEFTPQTFAALLEPLRNGQKSRVVIETLYRRKNGSPYQVEVRLQLLPTEIPPVFVAVVQDITERKDTEAQRHKLARAVDQTADPVIVTDVGGVIEYVNPAFERVTGYTPEEVFGRTPSFLRSGRHDENFYRRMWETILAGATFREVFINRRKDGSLYYEEKTITPLKDDHGLITHFISTGKDITESIHFQERLQHLAQHDVLTQLPNRLLFTERVIRAVKRAASRKGALAVLYLGIDRFDAINATLGQAMGDQLLRVVAERLRRAVRESDTVARLDGNAFGILLDGVASARETTLFAQKILLAVAQPFPLTGRELFMTGSIGVGLYPEDGKDVFALLRSAESAMVRAVEQGGNAIRFHEAAMDVRLAERLELETGLRRALEHKEFLLHYQPQMDLRTGHTCGVEALLRWQHPTRGLLEPAAFLPVLEETGLIVPVGVWVLRAACEQVQAWQATGLPALPITVKVSDREIADLDYADIVRMVLEETGLSPSLLHLEINHRMLSGAAVGPGGVAEALHRIGVSLVIGSFDVGTAPLGQLRQAHAAALNLDPGFVRNLSGSPEDATLLRAIVAVAHEIRLRVMAEGVEQEPQLRVLRSADCDAIMGFVFSKPLTAIEVARFAQRARPASP
ncbi:MAG: PAS domain S-box protein [Gammaproteobacteria bacterium]|nr:MAG: PAS domain S-box protein [Gammaproteobacteria bacterium]